MTSSETRSSETTGSLPRGYRRIGPDRIRENVGLGLSDFVAGQVIEHRPARTVTESDHVHMLALSGNPAPIHSDVRFCQDTGRDQIVVCGSLTFAIVLGATIRTTSGLTTANLALDGLRLAHPVFIGDILYAQSEVLEARRSQSQPNQGVVTTRVSGHNQHDHEVITFTRTFLVPADADELRDTTHY